MAESLTEIDAAVALMQMALAILDAEDEADAGCYLQHAIDIVTRQPCLQPGDEIDPDLIDRILGSTIADR